MTSYELARIETQARRMRAAVLSDMLRGLFRRTPRAPIATAHAA